ncbi:MAG: 3-keto-5-aminohexanoate cleavage protein [Bacillota bacterium]
MRKIIVAVAPVALGPQEGVKSPLTPEEVAEEVVACARLGASVVHLHVRDREGRPTDDLTEFSRTLELITEGTDIIIQGSTGGVSELTVEQRCVALREPRVETASLNMGSANFDEGVYVNTFPEIRYWAGRMKEEGIHPELEVFEAGMINNVALLAEEGVLSPPFVFAFCLGFRGALPADARSLFFLQTMLPPGARWGLIHHGMKDFSLLAVAAGMGASFIRVGFEDSPFLAPGRVAQSNVELVAQAVSLVRTMGLEMATVEEARAILGLPPGGRRNRKAHR